MIHVAFVCLGNICRSPTAETIMRQRLQKRDIPGIKIHSRRAGRWSLDEPPHNGAQKILQKYHIPYNSMVNGLFEPNDDFDYIITMDRSNIDSIKRINPDLQEQSFKLLEFSNMKGSDAPDPYYANNFEGVFEIVQSSCDSLVDYIVRNASLRER